MKILFLGSLISGEAMEELNRNSREKASVAPVNYETMLVKGLRENGHEVEAISVPAVAAYPGSVYKTMPKKEERLSFGVSVRWLPFVNLPILKQWSIKRSATRALKKWLKENKETTDKAVMMYSVYPPYSAPAVRLCKKYGCHLNTVITDLPEYMYSWKQSRGLKGWYAGRLSRQMLDLQTRSDSYVLFTEKMAARMGVEDKPYLVSEGFSDIHVYDGLPTVEKYDKKTVVYAGNLSRLYGIRPLVDAFMQTDGDYELHLYGAGPDAAYIQESAAKDARIKFFGRVERREVLTALRRAHLIAINKPTADDYSNYSFSSKILECMTSGTPVLMTRVGGMPTDYYDYVYFWDDESVAGLSGRLSQVLDLPTEDLAAMGRAAADFAVRDKDYVPQCKKISDFLENTVR